jgi:hypothetical protein
MLKKLKTFGLGLDRTATLERVDKNMGTPENRGEEIIRHHGEALDVLCTTKYNDPVDQENKRKFKLNWWTRFGRALRIGVSKKIDEYKK